MPESRTVTSVCDGRTASSTSTSPPGGVYFTALSIRVKNNRRTVSASPRAGAPACGILSENRIRLVPASRAAWRQTVRSCSLRSMGTSAGCDDPASARASAKRFSINLVVRSASVRMSDSAAR